jgi:hypothetical protein
MDTDKQTSGSGSGSGSESQYSGRLIEGLMRLANSVSARHARVDHTLCAECCWPKWAHAQGRYEWCPVRTGGEVFTALLCDYTGPETRDGLADGEMCMQAAVVVGIESGQCYCLRHWERAQ